MQQVFYILSTLFVPITLLNSLVWNTAQRLTCIDLGFQVQPLKNWKRCAARMRRPDRREKLKRRLRGRGERLRKLENANDVRRNGYVCV